MSVDDSSDSEGSYTCTFFGIGGAAPPGRRANSSSSGSSSSSSTPKRSSPSKEDAELAKELNALSMQERDKLYDDIHGVASIPEESPEFVASCIAKLDNELKHLPKSVQRKAFDRALFLKPSLETDAKMKLRFLRADHYDAFASARRMVKYYEDKADLFGEDKLVKRLSLDDLRKEDRELLDTGFCIILPQKDTAGRTIQFFDLSKIDFSKYMSVLRVEWYMAEVTAEDETVELTGMSQIMYCPGVWGLMENMAKFHVAAKKMGDVLSNFPLRPTSIHFCYNSHVMRFIQSVINKTFGKKYRLRVRDHFGSDVEIQYSLMTYGIICPLLGSNEQLELSRLNLHRRQLLEQERQEAMSEEVNRTSIIPFPCPKDILVGRGWPYQTFSGNKMLGQVVIEFLDRFQSSADNFEKTCINLEVIRAIEERYGGRFLERTSEGWKVTKAQMARKKVNSAFRSAKSSPTSTPTGTGFSFSQKEGSENKPPMCKSDRRGECGVANHPSKRLRLVA